LPQNAATTTPQWEATKRLAELSHLNDRGDAHMVDVSGKPIVARTAVAEAIVRVSPETARAISAGQVPKGDVAAVARLGGIAASKRTSELVLLCHPLPIDGVEVGIDVDPVGVVTITATVRTTARTGVEMEALTTVSVAALNMYDMVKGIDSGPVIEMIRLRSKHKSPVSDLTAPTKRDSS
jgi:cyclic pyranopterin phosphate synthase